MPSLYLAKLLLCYSIMAREVLFSLSHKGLFSQKQPLEGLRRTYRIIKITLAEQHDMSLNVSQNISAHVN